VTPRYFYKCDYCGRDFLLEPKKIVLRCEKCSHGKLQRCKEQNKPDYYKGDKEYNKLDKEEESDQDDIYKLFFPQGDEQ
jgi:DNA-directed RNA polymerase subunit RPC12/RpoP